MSNRLRLFCLAAFFASGLLLPNLALAQIIYGEPQKSLSLHLENQFSRWEVYKVDAPCTF